MTTLEHRIWLAVEIVAIVGFIGGTAYYTYRAGWQGLGFAVLSAVFGWMAVMYFGHSMPIIGYFFDKWDRGE